MSDSYQATYDAVRSRIGGCDTQSAMESALRQAFGMSDHHMACVAEGFSMAAQEMQRPSAIYRPTLNKDGDQWCALFGGDLQSGVSGFGDTPELAMREFDKNWNQP